MTICQWRFTVPYDTRPKGDAYGSAFLKAQKLLGSPSKGYNKHIAADCLQTPSNPYYQSSKLTKSYAPTSKASLLTRSHATTRYKGKDIAKPITPPFESASKVDSNPEQAQKEQDHARKNMSSYCKDFQETLTNLPNNNLKTSSNTRNKNVDTTPRNAEKPKRLKDTTYHNEKMWLVNKLRKVFQLQSEQSDWLADTDEENDEQELKHITDTWQKEPRSSQCRTRGLILSHWNITMRY
ncbi:hypothetical protein Tco_1338804 [Tanacetum coccineum]